MQAANLVFKTTACDPLPNARGRGTLTRSRSDTHRRTALIRCQRPTDESPQAVAIKPCEKRSFSKGSDLQLSRRNLVTGTGLALSLTASSATLGGGPAFAEEAILWDGVGRRPNAIVTGANTGIGKSISEELARRGWSVTLACRNPSKAEAAAADIRAITGSDAIECKTLDLASFQSIHDFAEGWGDASSRPIDALINNAGVMAVFPQQFTKDGFELTFGVNHLGHFLLTCLLESSLRAGSVDGSAGGRVVVTSSAAHQLAQNGMNFNDLNYTTNSYKRWGAYGQSKLANILMMRELDRRCHQIDGCGVTAYSFHPGVVDTELIRYLVSEKTMDDKLINPERSKFLARRVFGLKSPEEGAATGVYLATSKEVEALHSEYFDSKKLGLCSSAGRNMEAAARLWEMSLELTGAPKGAWSA
mmetsp:Transcript_22177/g.37007  ORF Transcript_22177/g.37007 Transcript_22177/m.37007 type:complete len:418 (+) Transcript_22177:87-1340(+)